MCYHSTYGVVSVEEAAATLCIRNTLAVAHHEARGALAALHTGVALALGRGGEVGAGGGAWRHAGGVFAVGAARNDWGARERERERERDGATLGEME